MDRKLKKQIAQILNHQIEFDKVYSIHNKWLSEEEAESSLMCFEDIGSFADYEKMKLIADKYLSLLVSLNALFGLEFIDADQSAAKSNLSFNCLLKLSLGHIIKDNELMFFIPGKDIFVVLSHDFNIYLYNIKNVSFEDIHEVFLQSAFYELPR